MQKSKKSGQGQTLCHSTVYSPRIVLTGVAAMTLLEASALVFWHHHGGFLELKLTIFVVKDVVRVISSCYQAWQASYIYKLTDKQIQPD